jgi:hypothetical protein
MWDNICKTALSSASEIFSNASRGTSDAITVASTYLMNTTPPPKIIVNPALEEARKRERWEKDTTLIRNFGIIKKM